MSSYWLCGGVMAGQIILLCRALPSITTDYTYRYIGRLINAGARVVPSETDRARYKCGENGATCIPCY